MKKNIMVLSLVASFFTLLQITNLNTVKALTTLPTIRPTTTTELGHDDSLILTDSIMLDYLSCPDFALDFSKYQKKYEVQVLNNVTDLTITAIPIVKTSTVNIVGGKNLIVGDNSVFIEVIDLQGNKSTYSIIVKRLKENENIYNKYNDTRLFSLSVTGYNFEFISSKYEYNLSVDYKEEQLFVEAMTANKNATINIKYPQKIKNGEKIIITVTGQDKISKQDYIINIIKNKPKMSTAKIILYVLLSLLIIVLIILIIKIIQQKKADKILKLRNDKRVMNYGKHFDSNQVANIDQNNL